MKPPKLEPLSQHLRRQAVDGHLQFLRVLGRPLQPAATILDFGCGIGDAVALLLSYGFDAYGVDVVEYWGAGLGAYWERREKPPNGIDGRLQRIEMQAYRIPFPDCYFDFCFSDQVFEHVINPIDAFREIGRVLKPGGISFHRFPGPMCPIEGHVHLPFSALCQSSWYLAFWALLGRRSHWQRDMDWREVVCANKELMRGCHYPSKQQLRQYADAARLRIDFFERREFVTCDFGGLASLRKKAEKIGLGAVARAMLPFLAQRYMVIWPTHA